MKKFAVSTFLTQKLIYLIIGLIFVQLFFLGVYRMSVERILHRHYSDFPQELLSSLASDLSSYFNYILNAVVDASNEVAINSNYDSEYLRALLERKNAKYKIFNNGLYVFNKDGDLLAESFFKGDRRGQNFSFRAYYQEMIRLQKPLISDVYYSSLTHGDPCLMFVAPIFNHSGNFDGFIAGSINLKLGNEIYNKLLRFNQNDLKFSLYTHSGSVVVHHDRNLVGLRANLSEILTPLNTSGINGRIVKQNVLSLQYANMYLSVEVDDYLKENLLTKNLNYFVIFTILLSLISLCFVYLVISYIKKIFQKYLQKLSIFSNLIDNDSFLPNHRIFEFNFISDIFNKLKVIYLKLKKNQLRLEEDLSNQLNSSFLPNFIISETDYSLIFISDSCLKLLNVSKSELYMINIIDFIFKNSKTGRNDFVSFLSACSEEFSYFETHISSENYSRIWLKIHVIKQFFKNNKCYYCYLENVTETHDLIAEYKNLMSKYHKNLNIIDKSILLADVFGNVVFVNFTFKNQFFDSLKTVSDIFSVFNEDIYLRELFTKIINNYTISDSVIITRKKTEEEIFLYWQYELDSKHRLDGIMFIFSNSDIKNPKKG